MVPVVEPGLAQVRLGDQLNSSGAEMQFVKIQRFAGFQARAAEQLGLDRQLPDVGMASKHRLEQNEGGDVITTFGHERCEQGTDAKPKEDQMARACRVAEEVGGVMDALLPHCPGFSIRNVTGVTGSRIVETHGWITRRGEFFSQQANGVMRIKSVAIEAGAHKDSDVAAHALLFRV